LGQVGLRRTYGVTLLSIRRNSETLSNPGADTVLQAGDISILVGEADRLAQIQPLFESGGQGHEQ
ncbi:MAG: potassium:proton antiporter, partial [Syntrophobacteraceae bacterium]|nr:potassium:proton antiporter [Syntrophobacteraceae bacterium]